MSCNISSLSKGASDFSLWLVRNRRSDAEDISAQAILTYINCSQSENALQTIKEYINIVDRRQRFFALTHSKQANWCGGFAACGDSVSPRRFESPSRWPRRWNWNWLYHIASLGANSVNFSSRIYIHWTSICQFVQLVLQLKCYFNSPNNLWFIRVGHPLSLTMNRALFFVFIDNSRLTSNLWAICVMDLQPTIQGSTLSDLLHEYIYHRLQYTYSRVSRRLLGLARGSGDAPWNSSISCWRNQLQN
jgi:hypothetical protein